eukprot:COSAG01_NODE_4391_length_5072_cov_2.913533_6_plen_187_part_00
MRGPPPSPPGTHIRVQVEIMGSKNCRIVGKSQSALMMSNPIIFTRTRTRAVQCTPPRHRPHVRFKHCAHDPLALPQHGARTGWTPSPATSPDCSCTCTAYSSPAARLSMHRSQSSTPGPAKCARARHTHTVDFTPHGPSSTTRTSAVASACCSAASTFTVISASLSWYDARPRIGKLDMQSYFLEP